MLRRTPCIGICSTTYGDLVCRGCKRFAHEIVGWNAYDRGQRQAVWDRLISVRAGAIRHLIEVVDEQALKVAALSLTGMATQVGEWAGDMGSGCATVAPEERAVAAATYLLAYEVLQHCAALDRHAAPDLGDLGLRVIDTGFKGGIGDLVRHIDRECFERSVALYERNFRMLAR